MSGYEPMTSGSKTCTNCGDEQHVLCFPADKQNRDGLSSWCRHCSNNSTNKTRARKARRAGTRGRKATFEAHMATFEPEL